MKLFINFFNNSIIFNHFINKLKREIINLTIKSNYVNILARIRVYYQDSMHIIKEDCLSKCYRVLFTDLPSPYHYDYCLNNNSEYEFERFTYTIRQWFGYSKRLVCIYKSKSSSHISHSSSFHRNNAVSPDN